MGSLFKRLIIFFSILIGLSNVSFATHLRAGEITIERKGCGNTFAITITVYTNTGSPIKFGDGVLDYGDGSKPFITPSIDNTLRPDLGPNIGTVSFTIEHTYGAGTYIISYLEANRNAGVLNMFNSVDTRFYIETKITIDPFLGCDNTPRLLVPPIDKGCTGVAWLHNPGAYDPDGDSLSFELVIPKKAKNTVVDRYQDPNVVDFYTQVGIDYNKGNETRTNKPTFLINPVTGTITWDAPGATGQYNIAFLIKEWRKIGGVYFNIGYVTRDMQIEIEDCINKRPELKIPADICVEAGTTINQTIFGTDLDYNDVKIEVFSEALSIQPSPATYAPNPPVFQTISALKDATVSFTWATKCEHIKEQPYQVVFKITDKPKPGSGTQLVQFKTWNIRIIGPAPAWKNATVSSTTRQASLEWDSYTCKNATGIQVWRRVNSYPWTPPECVTGIPDFLGYTLVGTTAGTATKYVDTNNGLGLAVGAQYCYRLVAAYAAPGGGFSVVSKEICLDPIIGAAPIITNVTIDKTDKTAGQITVKWRSPLGVDKTKFPSPYTFAVTRAEGFSGNIAQKSFLPISDSTLVDTGTNTVEKTYNYNVLLIDANKTKLDTSASASTVRLELKPRAGKIELFWNAIVPWNNKTQKYPKHLIYRGLSGSGSPLALIDSIDVNQNQFHYIDSGRYNNTPLKEAETYCYQVATKGSYGNKKLPEPLVNFSEVVCAKPIVETVPCKPIIDPTVVAGTNCDDALQAASCNQKTFSNFLNWKRSKSSDCIGITTTYNIYIAGAKGDEFKKVYENVKDTFFVDSNLPSYARCYKISAVNRSGKESELSEAICFDNCPYYELPNVFTPNGDLCNEKFSAYNDRDAILGDNNAPCGKVTTEIRKKCARFVDKVVFTVVNRWGKEVYTYESGGERSIYIDWDGKDNGGRDLAAGVYYYTADVTFNVVDPSKKNQKIKGWVQLIR